MQLNVIANGFVDQVAARAVLRCRQRVEFVDLCSIRAKTDGLLTVAHNTQTIAGIIWYYNSLAGGPHIPWPTFALANVAPFPSAGGPPGTPIHNQSKTGWPIPPSFGGVGLFVTNPNECPTLASVGHRPGRVESCRSIQAELREPRDAGKSVEARVETQDLLDAVLLHDRQMHGVASGEFLILQHDLLGPLDRSGIDRQHLIRDTQQCIKRRLNGAAAMDRNITMKNFLQHLGVGHQPLAVADEFLQQALGIDFVR